MSQMRQQFRALFLYLSRTSILYRISVFLQTPSPKSFRLATPRAQLSRTFKARIIMNKKHTLSTKTLLLVQYKNSLG